MAKKQLLYLLGPMTGYLQDNHPTFNKWAQQLRAEGYDIINPAELDEILGPCKRRAEYYMRDSAFLEVVDGGVAMQGWRSSKGARWEAYTLGVMYEKPVFQLPDMTLISPELIPAPLRINEPIGNGT